MEIMKKVLILGSSGSIGVNALNVLKQIKNEFQVVGLTVNTNTCLLAEQVKEFKPSFIVIKDKRAAEEFKSNFTNLEILEGETGLIKVTQEYDYDILISALVGFAGLAPTIETIKRNKRIALANKETLVVAGEIINKLLEKHDSEIIPVDSEHSAIFQCLVGEDKAEIHKLILTASGGPFLNKSKDELEDVSVSDALKHPNWQMGAKITIDSATMMNKGLEVIEAHWLFGLHRNKIDILIHPQSIIHSMVEFVDGSIKAQLSEPDMKLPIQYALTYPKHVPIRQTETHFSKIKELTFFEPDFNKFTCLKLAYDAMELGGTAPCILNAANEVAVKNFLMGKINFLQIPEIIDESLNEIENHINPDIETIFECDKKTREFAESLK